MKTWRFATLLGALLLTPALLAAQATGTITGVVTGTNGAPLSGASVQVVGTTRGSQTDAQGRYTITGVPAGSRMLRANFAGYAEATRPVTVAAAQSVTLNVTLTQQAVQLEGLVAIGYGTARARDVTGAVATVQMDAVRGSPITSPDAALRGMVPGVVVSQATGVPGGGPQIQIRGISAVGAGSAPLYVVDGIPVQMNYDAQGVQDQIRNPLATIPAEDIESMTVLKDASATAIYGSRGSNGVVLVTTRRGRAGVRPQINVTASSGLQTLGPQGPPNMLSATDFALYHRSRARDGVYLSKRRNNPNADPAAWQPTNAEIDQALSTRWRAWIHTDTLAKYDNYRNLGVDWYQEGVEEAPMNNVNVSISGGNERLRSYLSGGLTDQRGIQRNTGFQRFAARANIDATLNERITLAVNLAPTLTNRNLANEQGVALNTHPLAFTRDPATGALRSATANDVNVFISSNGTPTNMSSNGLYTQRVRDSDERSVALLGSATANVEILDNLTFRSSFNVNRTDERRNTYNPARLQADGTFTIPDAQWRQNQNWSWANENLLTLSATEFTEGQTFDALLGFSTERRRTENAGINASNFPDAVTRLISSAATITTPANAWAITQSGLASLFARANYNFADRYIVTGTIRRDGSSRFGTDNRWGTFPSAAFAWNVSNESFMQDVTWAQDLKLRVSYGFSGNNQIGDFSYLSLVSPEGAGYVFNNTAASGRQLATMGNRGLGWEKLREFNTGLEASFLDGRLGLTADYYYRETTDLLLDRELSGASGFQTVKENLGAIENQGLELSLNTINVDLNRVRWATNFNIAANRNKVLSLGDRDFLTSDTQEGNPGYYSEVGQPLARHYGFKSCGIYGWEDDKNSDGFITSSDGVATYSGATPGSMKWCDRDGNGAIEPQLDYYVLGNPYPDFTWAMTNNLTMGAFDLRVLVQGAMGQDKKKRYTMQQMNLDENFNVLEIINERWRPGLNADGTPCVQRTGCASENPNAPVPVLTNIQQGQGSPFYRHSHEFQVQNADYAWVKSINLTYSLPQRLLSGRLPRGSVYVNLDNAFIFTKYDGNPESERAGNLQDNTQPPALTPAADNNVYPIARTFTLGVNLGL